MTRRITVLFFAYFVEIIYIYNYWNGTSSVMTTLNVKFIKISFFRNRRHQFPYFIQNFIRIFYQSITWGLNFTNVLYSSCSNILFVFNFCFTFFSKFVWIEIYKASERRTKIYNSFNFSRLNRMTFLAACEPC